MSTLVDVRVLELLAARLCHELISPVTAIANGAELLGEDDPDFASEAAALVGQSARKAGQRLQFYRFAYGTAGGGMGGPDAGELVRGLMEGTKIVCDWRLDPALLPAEWLRLAGNLVVLAGETLPRGGTVSATSGPAATLTVAACGEAINFAGEARAALASQTAPADLTPRTVHAHFTACLAGRFGARLTIVEDEPGRLVFMAAPDRA